MQRDRPAGRRDRLQELELSRVDILEVLDEDRRRLCQRMIDGAAAKTVHGGPRHVVVGHGPRFFDRAVKLAVEQQSVREFGTLPRALPHAGERVSIDAVLQKNVADLERVFDEPIGPADRSKFALHSGRVPRDHVVEKQALLEVRDKGRRAAARRLDDLLREARVGENGRRSQTGRIPGDHGIRDPFVAVRGIGENVHAAAFPGRPAAPARAPRLERPEPLHQKPRLPAPRRTENAHVRRRVLDHAARDVDKGISHGSARFLALGFAFFEVRVEPLGELSLEAHVFRKIEPDVP